MREADQVFVHVFDAHLAGTVDAFIASLAARL